MIINLELLIDPISVLDDESPGFFAIIKDFEGAINRSNLLTQKVPTKMGLTGRLPTCTGSSV
jgi:hypothetical protein